MPPKRSGSGNNSQRQKRGRDPLTAGSMIASANKAQQQEPPREFKEKQKKRAFPCISTRNLNTPVQGAASDTAPEKPNKKKVIHGFSAGGGGTGNEDDAPPEQAAPGAFKLFEPNQDFHNQFQAALASKSPMLTYNSEVCRVDGLKATPYSIPEKQAVHPCSDFCGMTAATCKNATVDARACVDMLLVQMCMNPQHCTKLHLVRHPNTKALHEVWYPEFCLWAISGDSKKALRLYAKGQNRIRHEAKDSKSNIAAGATAAGTVEKLDELVDKGEVQMTNELFLQKVALQAHSVTVTAKGQNQKTHSKYLRKQQ